MTTTSTATSSLPPLPNGIVRYSDYVAAQKNKPSGSTTMGQGEFMTLFTTQLQNQDPTDPVKNEAFVAQLAQFSQLEATTSMQTSLNTMVTNQSSDRMLTSAALIGKKVGIPTGPAVLTNAQPVTGTISLPGGADGLQVVVSDSTGNAVRTMTYGPQTPGSMNFTWDGLSDNGAQQPDGTYSLAITGTSGGANITPSYNTMSTVTSVTSSGDASNTWLLGVGGGKTVTLNSLTQITN
jgi:flagellar basal-body rod modification protein FlgD